MLCSGGRAVDVANDRLRIAQSSGSDPTIVALSRADVTEAPRHCARRGSNNEIELAVKRQRRAASHGWHAARRRTRGAGVNFKWLGKSIIRR